MNTRNTRNTRQIPSSAELPSSQQLQKSTFTALAIAALLLVTVVLPSEYAIDPTGIGRALGLNEMGEIKTQLAAEAEADRAVAPAASEKSSEYCCCDFGSCRYCWCKVGRGISAGACAESCNAMER
jgi:hypothetical protein